jgi:signal transduction histidine kinase
MVVNDRATLRSAAGGDRAITIRQLAHELNSLLDGSLRSVGLAAGLLRATEAQREATAQVCARLQAAQQAMWRMADLLERAMKRDSTVAEVLGRGLTLGDEAQRVRALLEPLAVAHGVTLGFAVDGAAASLPSGPLGSVLINGARNAIEACARGGEDRRCVEVAISAAEPATLRIEIADTGPGPQAGLRPGGHGLGSVLGRQIVEGLGGTYRLTHEEGRGTTLRVVVPLERLLSEWR